MSNAIISAAKGLSLAEKRVLSLCISKVTPDTGLKVRVTAVEYAERYQIPLTDAFDELASTSDSLFQRYIRTRTNGSLRFRWLSSVQHSRFDQSVEVRFSEEIAPYLDTIQVDFSAYIFSGAPHLQSIYSWRLLDIYNQAQEQNIQSLSFSTNDFCDLMEVPKSYRYDFHNLKIRVIDPAVDELKEKNNIIIRWETENPFGKKIANINFYFDFK